MASDDAKKVAEVLAAKLEELAWRTSRDIQEYWALFYKPNEDPILCTGDSDPQIGPKISKWLDDSAALVKSAFEKLLRGTKSPEEAESLLWDGIEAAFGWSKSREDSGFFDNWLRKTGLSGADFKFVPHPRCERYQISVPSELELELGLEVERVPTPDVLAQLNCTFLKVFELCIDEIAVEDATLEAGDLRRSLPAAEARDPDLGSEDPHKLGLARARVVERVERELCDVSIGELRARTLEELAREHSDYSILHPDVRGYLKDQLKDPNLSVPTLRFKMAAKIARCKHCGPESMRKAWYRYRKEL